MSINTIKKIYDLEIAVLKRKGDISADEARKYHDKLISYYEKFVEKEPSHLRNNLAEKDVTFLYSTADFVQKKTLRLEKILRRFFPPEDAASSTETNSKVNDQPETDVNLNSLLRKQKLYIQMIDSLEPKSDLSSKQAEYQIEHLEKFYEKFTLNQDEIAALVEEDSFEDQVEVSKQVHQKVLDVRTKLEEIFAPPNEVAVPLTALTVSFASDKFTKSDRPHVTVKYSNSLLEKQKSLIEQIESIGWKNCRSPKEAKAWHDHLSLLHKSFISNQSDIEAHLTGSTLESQLRISREILQKVTSLQTKLKQIFGFNAVELPPDLNQFNQTNTCMKWLLEKQTTLIKEIEYLDPEKLITTLRSSRTISQQRYHHIDKINEWFVSNQKKIELLVSKSKYDLEKQKKISKQIETMVLRFKAEYMKLGATVNRM